MNMHRMKKVAIASVLLAGAIMGRSAVVEADSLDQIYKVGQAKTEAAQSSQKRVDKLADETRDRLQDYKTVLKQVEGLKVYNARLDKQINNQLLRIQGIEESISQVTVVSRQMLPLVIRMIDSLEEFVGLDIPFKKEERDERISFLRANIDRSDLTVAEKFRQVLEAYKIEAEYGRKIDTYEDSVDINGVTTEVNILRIGRIGLMYQTTDGKVSGAYDSVLGDFTEVDSGLYKVAISKGIRIALNQATKDVMTLPVKAPEVAQ
jgi:hypothetical protein